MKAILTLAAALSIGACATIPTHAVALSTDGIASLGQSTLVGTLIVTPQAVVEDSRCPINARCVWAGRLIVKARIAGRGWTESANLTWGVPYRTHGTGLALVSGEPGKMAGSPPSPPVSMFGFEAR